MSELYSTPTIDLSVARTGSESAGEFLEIGSGTFCTITDISSGATVYVALDDPNVGWIPLHTVRTFVTPFKKLYIKNSAQVGASCTLLIGRSNQFSAVSVVPTIITSGITASNDILNWGGTALTGRDISGDLANLDTPLSRLIATTPVLYEKTMTLADTEYSQALPANCKRFTIHCQDGTAFRLAYVTGKVATPTAPYYSIPAGAVKSESGLYLAATTLYVACGTAGKKVEIEAWT